MSIHDADLFVIITERDVCADKSWRSGGAIIHEQYTDKCRNLAEVLEIAKKRRMYGEVFIAKVEIIGDLEEVEKLLKQEQHEVEHGNSKDS